MTNAIVRIESIEVKNFKNVGYGYLDFENTKKEYKSSILGLYGQNGSGKTALIDALELLRLALSGRSVPEYFADYINVESDHATVKYGLSVRNPDENSIFTVFYEVSIRRDTDDLGENTGRSDGGTIRKTMLFGEVLSYACDGTENKVRLSVLFDTRPADTAFIPKAKYNEIIGKSRETATNLLVAKRLARHNLTFVYLLEGVYERAARKLQGAAISFPDGRSREFRKL